MSNDEVVKRLKKKLSVKIKYSGDLKNKNKNKLDENRIESLAKKINKDLKDHSVEDTIQ